MKIGRQLRWVLILGIALLAASVFADDFGSISGFVRDSNGNPIKAATVTLIDAKTPPLITQATSDRDGHYEFNGIRTGDFNVSVALLGYISPPTKAVTISSSALNARVDFTLALQSSQLKSDDASKSSPPPQFQAAGVRGLIDPGGYSAAADAAAASRLIRGIADIKREDKDPSKSTGTEFPCGLETALLAEIAAKPDSAMARQNLGNFYVAHNQFAKAIPLFEQAHRIDGSDNKITQDLAIAQLKDGRFDAARELLIALSAKQNDATVHQLLAWAQEGSGMFAEASLQYQIAAQLQPSENSLFGAGYELILAGLPANAARAFAFGMKQYPTSIKLVIGAGTAEFLEGNAAAGIHLFLQATNLDPSDPRPYPFLAGASAIQAEDSRQVRETFKRFLELAPENPDAPYYYALSLWDLRELGFSTAEMDQIEKLLKRAIQLKPDYARAHFQLAALYAEREDFQGAVREYQAALAFDPELNVAHYRLANAYRHTGQDELAAHESQLFQASHDQRRAQADAGEISISQFVSVLTPREDSSTPKPNCPSVKP